MFGAILLFDFFSFNQLMNNILICTDCSENAKKATEQCFSLFQHEPKNYLLLSSYNIPNESSMDIIALTDGLKKKVENCLQSEKKRLQALPYSKLASLTSYTVFGKTENVVNRMIDNNKIDLVVLGNQGENFRSDRLFGSTTEKLIADIACPKLIVPQKNNQAVKPTQLVIADAQQLQNSRWWSNVSSLNSNQNYKIQLVVIPTKEDQFQRKEPSVPSYLVDEAEYVHMLTGKTISEMHETLNRLVQNEQPTLLNINFSDEKLARQIIQPSNQKDCICNKVPFIIHPFMKSYLA